jgi:hypothetical protein
MKFSYKQRPVLNGNWSDVQELAIFLKLKKNELFKNQEGLL